MKKGVKLFFRILGICTTLMMIFGVTSMAGNVSDHIWGYDESGNCHYFTAGTRSFTSDVRVKEDDTSTWCQMNGGSLDNIRIVIYGSSGNNTSGTNCTGGSLSNPTSYYTVRKNDTNVNSYFMNTVNEHGLGYSYLEIYSFYYSGTATGVWSPDSV